MLQVLGSEPIIPAGDQWFQVTVKFHHSRRRRVPINLGHHGNLPLEHIELVVKGHRPRLCTTQEFLNNPHRRGFPELMDHELYALGLMVFPEELIIT